MPRDVTIRLTTVNFTPTMVTTDDDGKVLSRWTQIGQMAFDIEEIPVEMRDEIEVMIADAYRKQFAHKFEEKSDGESALCKEG